MRRLIPSPPPRRRAGPRRTSAGGFTLIEMVVTVTVLGILFAWAVPAFNNFVLNARVQTAAFDFFSTLTLARSEAMKRGLPVDVNPNSSDWAKGWTVQFQSGSPATVTVLRQQGILKNLAVTPAPAATMTYRQDGRLQAGSFNGTIVFSPPGGSPVTKRCVTVNLSGLPHIQPC